MPHYDDPERPKARRFIVLDKHIDDMVNSMKFRYHSPKNFIISLAISRMNHEISEGRFDYEKEIHRYAKEANELIKREDSEV